METVRLNNGVEMPLLGLGTWDLRGKDCVRVVSEALAMGYRLIDTAQMYANEAEVGQGMKKSGVPREQIFLTTKIYRPSNSYDKAKQAIALSLERLGTDYIDLLLLHEPYAQGPAMYRALEEALAADKVRAIGISNYDPRWYTDFLARCDVVPAVNQLECHVFFQKADFQQEMLHHGTVLQAWAPLASGEGGVPTNTVLRAIGESHGKTAAQVALRFLVQRGISVIPKSQHIARLRENLALFDFTLSDDEMDAIRNLDRKTTFFPWTQAFGTPS